MKRNITLDFFKIFLGVLVVTIHTAPLPDIFPFYNWLISKGIARIAVPLFFIISGYFLVGRIEHFAKLKKYLIHLFIVYIVWYVIYLYDWISLLQAENKFTVYEMAVSFLMGYFHLWFLPALISGVLILYVAKKILRKDSIILAVAFALLLTAICLWPSVHLIKLFRNGLFFGFPFLAIGYGIKQSALIGKIKNTPLVALTVLSSITLIAESYLCYNKGINTDLHFSLLLLCPALFILVMKHSQYVESKNYVGELSSAIYFTHIFVINHILTFGKNTFFQFPLILMVTVLLSIIIIFVNKRLKIFL